MNNGNNNGNDTNSNLKVVNMGAAIKIPQYIEVCNGRNPWVLYGENNLYPDYLISLQNRSGKHSAIIKGKAAIIGGRGFSKEGISDSMKLFIKNVNNKLTLDEVLARISYDTEIFGAYALNVIWSRDRTKVAEISYLDVSKVRISRPDSKEGEGFWVCDDWSNTRKFTPKFFPKFNEQDRKAASTILYVKEYRPGNEWYGQPEYISAVNWITLEYEISQFHLSNVANGFHPSMVINFTSGVPSEDEMAAVTRSIEKRYEGAKNGGKVIFTFSEDKDHVPVFTPIQLNNSDERFTKLNQDVEDGIYQGHRVTNPALFGVKTPGELGNTNNLAADLAVFNIMYALPKQERFEETFKMLASINGINEAIDITQLKIDIPAQIQPVRATEKVSDILLVLAANIPDAAKRVMLSAFGYEDQEITLLLTQPATAVIPQPTQTNPQ